MQHASFCFVPVRARGGTEGRWQTDRPGFGNANARFYLVRVKVQL